MESPDNLFPAGPTSTERARARRSLQAGQSSSGSRHLRHRFHLGAEARHPHLWIVLDEMDLMWIPVERSWRMNEVTGALQA
jgi:bisphosphoglycerate-dependent phosphoglycerate mutase